MYAIVRIAGRQFMVKEGQTFTVPKLDADAGTTVKFDDITFLRTKTDAIVGRPKVEGGSVEAEVLEHPRAAKVTVFKFRRREKYRRKLGHRQQLTRIRVSSIKHAG
ncbi:MAG TPA: 50S ribosomal protein L21 [candidate division WOR-3 bacterium]|uniref:Large ribosomal subunit protein bL21 n=1 Tax=candidate division WOR-3 bacterium TaxID=2052148 RepID=A0A7V0T4N9_UNCW3|nr:50S ribosomal protein L21 [candidate division WOR-3 bacterium]